MKDYDVKTRGLARLLLIAKTEGEMYGLIHDLFTVSEIAKAHERARIFDCLDAGLSQRETQKKTHAVIATVTHGAQFLRNSACVISDFLHTAQQMSWWHKLFWQT